MAQTIKQQIANVQILLATAKQDLDDTDQSNGASNCRSRLVHAMAEVDALIEALGKERDTK